MQLTVEIRMPHARKPNSAQERTGIKGCAQTRTLNPGDVGAGLQEQSQAPALATDEQKDTWAKRPPDKPTLSTKVQEGQTENRIADSPRRALRQ